MDEEEWVSNENETLYQKKVQANTIAEGLIFTEDSPRKNCNGRSLVLHTEIWKESRNNHVTIRYTFYEKLVTFPMVFHA